MHHIYCISGLGADHRIFQNLQIENAELHFVEWAQPEPGDDLRSYAIRLAEQIKHDRIILMGVSFGGMLATEISHHFNSGTKKEHVPVAIDKTLLISSCKSFNEFPAPMKWTGRLNLHKLAPYNLILGNNRLNRIVFDLRSKEEELYLKRKMLRENDLGFLKHAIHMIMKWNRTCCQVDNLIHIHGKSDGLLLPKNVQADFWVNNGGHFMVWNKAAEISKIINEVLAK